MKVLIAKKLGFCFGVKRAYDMVEDIVKNKKEGENISTFGPLIHNDRLIKDLEEKGVSVINDIKDAKDTVIIRSHGISNKKKEEIKKNTEKYLDATCPFVTKVHIVTQNFQKRGFQVIIIGDKDHPELKGIIEDLDNVICIQTIDEAKNLSKFQKVGVAVQTTFKRSLFKEICKILEEKCDEIEIEDTICGSTFENQTAAKELAKEVDAMIVIGGTKSSNTKKLAEVCSEFCPTQKIESIKDLDLEKLKNINKVGVTAGASTPQYQIDEVVKFLKEL